MRQKSNYIFSLLILALAAAVTPVSGQDIPVDTTETQTPPDTAVVPAPDTVGVDMPSDTVGIETDSIETPADSAAVEEAQVVDTLNQAAAKGSAARDTLKPIKKPNGVGLYVDYLKLANQFLYGGKKYEGGLNVVIFKRISLVVEAGAAVLQPPKAIKNGSYTSEGVYGRAGLDLLVINTPENKLFLGLRAARSRFEDRGKFQIESVLWEPYEKQFERNDLEATWYEIVAGTEGVIFPHLYAGWIVRYRMINERPHFQPVDVYNIPGYGIANDSGIALNLYLRFFISW